MSRIHNGRGPVAAVPQHGHPRHEVASSQRETCVACSVSRGGQRTRGEDSGRVDVELLRNDGAAAKQVDVSSAAKGRRSLVNKSNAAGAGLRSTRRRNSVP